jgi:hypothetical protein
MFSNVCSFAVLPRERRIQREMQCEDYSPEGLGPEALRQVTPSRRDSISTDRPAFGVPHRFGEIPVQKSLNTWVSKKALALTIFSPWTCRNHE